MKKILSVLLATMLLGCTTGCNNVDPYEIIQNYSVTENDFSNDNTNNSSNETNYPLQPQTYMDLFKGERKVWIYTNGLKHNSEVKCVFVIEKSKLIEAYHIGQSYTEESGYSEYNEVILSDFDAMTDEEILSFARANGQNFATGFATTPPQQLPREITYSGELDSSGNALVREFINFMHSDTSSYNVFARIANVDFLQPTTIKNREYVGIQGTISNTCLVTRNTFGDITNLKLDPADGAVEPW